MNAECNFAIERCSKADAQDVWRLEQECLSAPWRLRDIEAAISDESYVLYKAVIAGKLVGYGGVQMVLDEGNITNVAVFPKYRRRGAGEKILAALLDTCRGKGIKKVYLEVYAGNTAAVRLYEKHGFYKAYTRKGYYKEGDAIVMSCEVLCSDSSKG